MGMTVIFEPFNFDDLRLVGRATASDGTIQPFVMNFTQAQLRDFKVRRYGTDFQETASAFVATMRSWLQNQEDLIERIKQGEVEDILTEFLKAEELIDQSE